MASWRTIREEVLNAEPLCRLCKNMGLTVSAEEVDHIVPIALGGDNNKLNLQPICRDCHERKTARENSFKLQINEDGWPSGDYRKRIIARREGVANANRKRWGKKRQDGLLA